MSADRRRRFETVNGVTMAIPCPDCHHTKCGESCVCDCDLAFAEVELDEARGKASKAAEALQALERLLLAAQELSTALEKHENENTVYTGARLETARVQLEEAEAYGSNVARKLGSSKV